MGSAAFTTVDRVFYIPTGHILEEDFLEPLFDVDRPGSERPSGEVL